MIYAYINKARVGQFLLLVLGISVIFYASFILIYVSSSYDIGINSILTPIIRGKPTNLKDENLPQGPSADDLIVQVGYIEIRTWADLLLAPGKLQKEMEDPAASFEWRWKDTNFVRIRYQKPGDPGTTHEAWCELQRLPLEELIPSLIWLFLKGALFVIGALVYWKRPDDESALRFYIVCVVTVGAYIGGYHWTHIVTDPVLMIAFMICAVLLPAANLHFYLVFPHKKPWLERYPGRILAAVYGVPVVNLICLIGIYGYVKWIAEYNSPLRPYLPWPIYASFGLAMLWYLGCMLALMHSWRTVEAPLERKQVKCILIAVFFSLIPIGLSLYIVLREPEKFVEGATTWPMFGASVMVTLAFALGMTRYRLMELDKIINSSVSYFLVSFLAGLMYYGVVFVGTLFYNRFVSTPTLPAALTVSTTALLFVLVLDMARSRIQKALDRRFSRNKLQLDLTLQQMSRAVSQLVDPPVLAQRLLSVVSETFGVTRGAIYLRQEEPLVFRQVASLGENTSPQELTADAPMIESLQSGLGIERPAPSDGLGTPAQQQLRQFGAEIAQPLLSEGKLMAVLLLGPKDMPFRAEDWNLLSAFAQITIVALESAAKHRTIEQLNSELQTKVDKIAEQQRRILALQTQLHKTQATVVEPIKRPVPVKPEIDPAPQPNVGGIVGSSPVVRQLLTLVRKVAATDAVVLLRGESGTGKELLARAVHETSPRAGKPYVKVHCAALSANLLESELFGHVKGAFTGAHRDKVGRFELANGGTLFLDEIGDISLEVQTKLLRVLQEKTLERVGSSDTMNVDVRIITATHQNLEELIRVGRFREDLFYRLNVFPIQVPSLRERCEDIPELAPFFIQLSSQRCKKSPLQIDDDVLALLKGYAWPGNIRQLENVIERAVVVAEGQTLTLQDMPAELFQAEADLAVLPAAAYQEMEVQTVPASSFRTQRDRFERDQVARALAEADGNKAEAARILGIARTTLINRMKKLGLDG